MADLSQLFAPQVGAPQRGNNFDAAGPKAAEFKRRMALNEAKQQGLSPTQGDDFYKFVGERLFMLGDAEGALLINQERQSSLAAQAQAQQAARQQGFENTLALNKDRRAEDAATREASAVKPPKSRTIRRGNKQVTQEFDETTGEFVDIAEGAAFAPPAVFNIGTEAEKMRSKAQVENEIALEQVQPVLNQYLETAKALAANPTPENFARFQQIQTIAAQALAKKRNPNRITDADVEQARESLPTPINTANIATGGGTFAAQVDEFVRGEGLAPVKAPTEMTDEEIKAELKRLKAKNRGR